jgi:molybdopterin synthase sulfur carrier subunit
MATVWVPAQLRDLTNGQAIVTVPGERVGQLIDAFERLFPGTRDRLCDDAGLRSGIAVVVDGEVARFGWLQQVGPASEVHFLPALSGG